jgi:hypothetical protein
VSTPRSFRSLLAISWGMLRRHPVVESALGGAVVLSLASVVFGIGVFVTPWFVCEIFALQLSILRDEPTERTGAWVRAGLLVLGMVGLVLAATWLALLSIGPDVATADSAPGPLPWPEAVERVGLIAAVTALTVGFITPLSYAPLILIDRGGRIGEAVLESAWLVRRGGLARHSALTFLAHLVPLLPALVAAVVVARTFERAATPLGVLLGLPLVPFSIPLGLGLLTAGYVARRDELPERRWTRAEGAPPFALRAVLIASTLAPVIGLAFLGVGALRPSPPRHGHASGELVLERTVGDHRLFVPDTTLEVRVRGRTVEVLAGDGSGTGPLPAPWRRPIERVRVLRRDAYYAIELHTGDESWVTRVDRAGVRVDDRIAKRLTSRLPMWALPSIALAFALSALLLAPALEPLGALRRAYGAPADERPPLVELRAQRHAALRRAWRIAAVLAPASALAVAGGLFAVLG